MGNQSYNILIVDDETDISEILKFNLENDGYEVTTVPSAEEAMALGIAKFDLLLLDVMMEGMSGFDLARLIKANAATSNIPIIFLTALDSEEDTVNGFNIGADDYISKPFSMREVMMRVRAVLKRTADRKDMPDSHLQYQGLLIDTDRKTVSVDGTPISLTKTEYELLRLLLEHRGRVFSRQELIARVWPSDVMVLDRTVDVNITRMRKKIGVYAGHVVTRLGFGYIFEA